MANNRSKYRDAVLDIPKAPSEGFYPSRRVVMDRVEEKVITPLEYLVYSFLLARADAFGGAVHNTPGVWVGSVRELSQRIATLDAKRSVQGAVDRLSSLGWIKTFATGIYHLPTAYLVHKMQITIGKDRLEVDASKSDDWRKPALVELGAGPD